MIIEIDTKSEIPIYTQLVFQIKKGIYKGKLKPGDSLPSVRSLAGDIGINLHTLKYLTYVRMSEKLEKHGIYIKRKTTSKSKKN